MQCERARSPPSEATETCDACRLQRAYINGEGVRSLRVGKAPAPCEPLVTHHADCPVHSGASCPDAAAAAVARLLRRPLQGLVCSQGTSIAGGLGWLLTAKRGDKAASRRHPQTQRHELTRAPWQKASGCASGAGLPAGAPAASSQGRRRAMRPKGGSASRNNRRSLRQVATSFTQSIVRVAWNRLYAALRVTRHPRPRCVRTRAGSTSPEPRWHLSQTGRISHLPSRVGSRLRT